MTLTIERERRFTEDLIEEWLGFKRASAKQVALRPHPYEFYLYSDV